MPSLTTRGGRTHLYAGGEPTKVPSANKKDVVFNSKTGRVSESGQDQGDCIPDEEFCVVDNDTGGLIRLTVEEKERIFLDALQSYYFNNKQTLSDEEFDLLKEDLSWSGSKVVSMNRNEAKYLTAVQDYLKGTPSMADEEFDALKEELRTEKSSFAVSNEPKCYIDSGICKVTLKHDDFRNNLLYLPAGVLLSLAWLGVGFEVIEPFVRLNPIILALLGAFPVIRGTKYITDEVVFTNNDIVYGQCPGCSDEIRVYFGDVLGVEGFSDIATIKCKSCKDNVSIQRGTLRASTLPKANR